MADYGRSPSGISWHAFRLTRSMMAQQGTAQRSSWLSLVAETAGVSGATVARVEIQGQELTSPPTDGSVRAIIQIQDDFGAVVGAGTWEGDVRDLVHGVSLDVGCDLGAGFGTRVVGWIEADPRPIDPARAPAPFDATGRYFDPTQAMKLMLRRPVRRAHAVRAPVPQVAAA